MFLCAPVQLQLLAGLVKLSWSMCYFCSCATKRKGSNDNVKQGQEHDGTELQEWLRLAPGPRLSKPLAVNASSACAHPSGCTGIVGCGLAGVRSSRDLTATCMRPLHVVWPWDRASVWWQEKSCSIRWILLSGSCSVIWSQTGSWEGRAAVRHFPFGFLGQRLFSVSDVFPLSRSWSQVLLWLLLTSQISPLKRLQQVQEPDFFELSIIGNYLIS